MDGQIMQVNINDLVYVYEKEISRNTKNKRKIYLFNLHKMQNICHILDDLERLDLLKRVKCVHINDYKNVRGSHKDRHANIGYGEIGFDNLINIIYNERLDNIPKILETPYIDEYAPYKYEIDMIRNKKFNENLYEDVKD